jgi:proteic killer suppression protein
MKRHVAGVIQSFADDTTRQIWEGIPVRRVPAELQQQARKRLSYLNAATRIEDLYIPPSNHFHAVGRRYAIRVNRQWRITFNWSDSGPSEVLLEDYH